MKKTEGSPECVLADEIRILTKMANALARQDTTCECDGCQKQDEFVERLRALAKWAGEETDA